jgi:hypothetical protein
MKRKLFLSLLFTGVISLVGCGGASFNTQDSTIAAVNVTCSPTSVSSGTTTQCGASVTGTGAYSSGVTWSVDSGAISSTGLYTAPSTAPASGDVTVTATSNQDKSKHGSGLLKFGQASSGSVSGVSVAAAPSSITLGQTSTCTANVSGTGNYSNTVNWSATGGNITQAGVFTPSAAGAGTCTATSTQDGTKSGTATITTVSNTVPPAPSTVTGVSVVASPSSISTSQTASCSANVSGTGTFSNSVTWTATGGTISQTGVFTPSGAGTGTCTATSTQDGTKAGSASISVTAPAPTVTGISVVANPSSINTSQTSTCVASVNGTGAFATGVTWTATGGTITPAGVFTPSGTGAGTCKATSTQSGYTNVSGSAAINVTNVAPTVTGITVVANPSSINTSQTSTCVATVNGTGAFATGVTWTATGGTITPAGVFTPSGTGAGTCKATSTQSGYTNVSGSAAINVTAVAPTVSGITVVANPSSITSSQTSTCSATVSGTGAFATGVTWTATGGTITPSGVFTPSGTGTGSCIAASTQSGYTNVTGSAPITVTSTPATITSIAVSASPTSITTGQTSQCSATVSGTGSYSSAVTWTATGGTISSTGLLTPSGAGTATCKANSTATGYTNITGSASITVTSAGPTITGVTLVCSPTSITTGQTATCTPTVTGTGSFTNTVSLSISPSGGSLSASTGVASGTAVTFTPPTTAETATITATSTQDSTKVASATVAVTAASGTGPSCSGMSLGNMGSLNGFVPFPSTNAWNTDISNASVDPNSSTIVGASGFAGNHLHHDWSSVAGGNYGIPYVVVDTSTQPVVPLTINAYASESDVAYAPYPANAPIELYPADCTDTGDQHVLVLDRNTCMLYETWNTVRCNGSYSADSETIWDLKNYENRPWGWTSADAAGLPVFPGLVRYDEVASGAINHALRFTMNLTKNDANNGYFVAPATHASGSNWGTSNITGMRIRLKASFDISGYSATNQIILTAMKKYGMILADNGSNFFFQGAPDPRWNDNDLVNLDSITSDNFEVVQMAPAFPGYDANTAPTGAAPTINSFTASASTVAKGTPVTLTWSTAGDSYDFIDMLGGVHGPSVTVTPTVTTTYTLNATNAYGRTTKAVTVTVQ